MFCGFTARTLDPLARGRGDLDHPYRCGRPLPLEQAADHGGCHVAAADEGYVHKTVFNRQDAKTPREI
jgi:hypothetical protein